jgi:ribosomal quality control pathway NFACT family protein
VSSKGRPYRTVRVGEFDVLVGRGDEENDILTFEVAEPDDLWLHVAGGVAGSHVVVRNPERLAEFPREVIEGAAALAAWYSKARNARKVDVHLCRVSDVSKPRGMPPGKVLLARWTRVRVSPSDAPGATDGETSDGGGRSPPATGQNVTGSEVSPRRVRLWRNWGASVASARAGSRVTRVLMAIWPSTRARGAPRQK